MKHLRFLLIGLGPHSKRIYLPFIKENGQKLSLSIALGVDVKEKKEQAQNIINQVGVNIEQLEFVPRFSHTMPDEVKKLLSTRVHELKIDAVIIATEPSAHKAYALWAMELGLPVLMDKPLSTRAHAVSDMNAAQSIFSDFEELNAAQKKSGTLFMVNSQRRYHPGMRKVYSLIREVAEKYKMPVTAIQSSDADGQWFFPEEVMNETYHGYESGYGKCSHSGYHYFDTIYQFYKAGYVTGKMANTLKVYASFIQPPSFFKQITQDDYRSFFGEAYDSDFSQEQLEQAVQDFGEIDSASTITFLQDKYPMCNVQLNLIHNSFCRRAWVKANKDLYKSNGRVKHEYHVIQQGPLQTIQIHGYQVSSDHNNNDLNEFNFGGNNHFDVYVFRNDGILGGQPLKMYSTRSTNPEMETIDENIPLDKLTYEYSRELAVTEFIQLLREDSKAANLSPLVDHALPSQIMSALYQSHFTGGPITLPMHSTVFQHLAI